MTSTSGAAKAADGVVERAANAAQRDARSSEAKVAVVMTCYNEGPYIGPAVRSVLEQTRGDLIESIVIADDGSDSATLDVLRDIEGWDPRIRILYGPGGAGLPAQRNLAIAATSAPLIAILDGDDLWIREKLAQQVPAIGADEAIGLVYSGFYTFGFDRLDTAQEARVIDITAQPELGRAVFLNDPPIIPSTVLMRRSAFEECGRFDASVRVFEDTDLYLRLARVTRFAFVATPLLHKRSRSSSITRARQDLMAYHAFVALRAAAHDPRLLPLVPRRLGERARKLGNHHFLLGDERSAVALLRLAVRLSPMNLRAWASLVGVSWLSRPIRWAIGSRLRARRLALGAAE